MCVIVCLFCIEREKWWKVGRIKHKVIMWQQTTVLIILGIPTTIWEQFVRLSRVLISILPTVRLATVCISFILMSYYNYALGIPYWQVYNNSFILEIYHRLDSYASDTKNMLVININLYISHCSSIFVNLNYLKITA